MDNNHFDRLTELEQAIGYRFKDKGLLKAAITHSSYAFEHNMAITEYNERLEFLGDAVLELVASEHLYNLLKDKPEGILTRTRASLVMGETLAGYALMLGIDRFLYLGNGEEASGGRRRPSILADAFEALVGAIYLDGGYHRCQEFVLRFLDERVLRICTGEPAGDYKTALQERVRLGPGKAIEYRVVDETGPEHQKIFSVEVLINGRQMGQGTGRSKKEAEQNAAKEAIEAIEELMQ
jgi:ribonuclease-3